MLIRGKLLPDLPQPSPVRSLPRARELLGINPENHQYHAGLRRALGLDTPDAQLTAEQRQRLSDIYARLQRKFPKSTAAKRIPLDFLVGAMDWLFRCALGQGPYVVSLLGGELVVF